MKTEEIDHLILIRPIEQEDVNFILATFLRGLYYGNSWFQEIDKQTFMETYHTVIKAILKKPTVQTLIASLKEDPSTILGYSILEPEKNAIHWIFVKDAFRKLGIAKRLIPKDHPWDTATHLTKIGKSLKPKDMKFNPFAL